LRILALFWKFLLHFEYFCFILYITASFWTLLIHFEHFCFILNISASFWTFLLQFVHFCFILNISASFWTFLLHFGQPYLTLNIPNLTIFHYKTILRQNHCCRFVGWRKFVNQFLVQYWLFFQFSNISPSYLHIAIEHHPINIIQFHCTLVSFSCLPPPLLNSISNNIGYIDILFCASMLVYVLIRNPFWRLEKNPGRF